MGAEPMERIHKGQLRNASTVFVTVVFGERKMNSLIRRVILFKTRRLSILTGPEKRNERTGVSIRSLPEFRKLVDEVGQKGKAGG